MLTFPLYCLPSPIVKKKTSNTEIKDLKFTKMTYFGSSSQEIVGIILNNKMKMAFQTSFNIS